MIREEVKITVKIGNVDFDVKNNTYVMGILNVTPDSFSDGGKYDTIENAKYQVEKMICEGADIIDVGGESTRPGFKAVSVQEETDRVIPVIEMIKRNFDIPVSVDTYKSKVAKEAVLAHVDLINDIWGLKKDPMMAKVIANSKLPCCLMHNRSHLEYNNFLRDVFADLNETIRLANEAGISSEKIILDPGVGFAKSYEQNLQILHYLEDFHQFGMPLLLAASKKSVIGNTLDLPVDERVEGTIVTTVMATMKNYSFVRVHDVKENKRAIAMTKKIMNTNIFNVTNKQ